jgi:LysR family transcriptional regulator, glycine cleavage system transcriptional activator
MKRPRLNALRTFEAAGRHLSFSIAGEELGVSQAAVSQQIRQLESHLDAKLFVRRNRGLSLTSVGDAYHLAVHEALDRLDAVTDQLFPGAEDHVVTVRCTPSVATLWLIPRLGRLHAALPGIELRIVTLAPEHGGSGPGFADIEIATLDAGEAGPDCRELLTALIAPVCAPSLLRQRRVSKPADLMGFDLLHVIGYRDDWHRWFRSAGLSEQKVPGGASFDGSLMALEAAANGDGVMLGRRPFIDPYLQSGDLVLLFGGRQFLTSTYFLRGREAARNRSDVNAVMDWLVEVASASASASD